MAPKTEGLEEAKKTYGANENLPPFIDRISDPDVLSGSTRKVWLPSNTGQWPTLKGASSHIVCQRWKGTERTYWTFTHEGKKVIVKSEERPDHQGWVGWHKWDGVRKCLSDTRIVFTKEEEPEALDGLTLFSNTGRSSRRGNKEAQAGQTLKHADSYQDLRRFATVLEGAERSNKLSSKVVDKPPNNIPRLFVRAACLQHRLKHEQNQDPVENQPLNVLRPF